MLINRRKFLRLGSLATGSSMLPKFLRAFESKTGGMGGNKVLVVLQLSGGNDGLNTVIPIRNDIYYRQRPGISISSDQALTLQTDT